MSAGAADTGPAGRRPLASRHAAQPAWWLALVGLTGLLALGAVPGSPARAQTQAAPSAASSAASSAAPSAVPSAPLLAARPAASPPEASTPPTAAPPGAAAARPRVGLVLSGGGARGYAHIGVLRVLQELRVPVDVVVGTSMGAVVGGAYAAGRSADELERFARDTDWEGVLGDRPPRRERDFRRREQDLEVPSSIEVGVGPGGSLNAQPALAGSQALEVALERLLPPGLAQRPAGRLALAFRAVATDLRTGELVEMGDEPLAVALRASLSVPALFPPLERDGRLLVDGGLVRNVPVDLARALGAQVLIVVNVGTPVDHLRELGSALSVAQQMINVLTEQNAQRSLRELQPGDILIRPELAGLDAGELATGAPRAIAAGQAAARALAGRLAALGVQDGAWQAFEHARAGQSQALGSAQAQGRMLVRPTGRASAELLAAAAGVRLGQTVDAERAREAADRLYASGDFERVGVQSSLLPDGRAMILVPVEAPWRQNPLRLGLEMQTEQGSREDATSFAVTALSTFSHLNAWGGELRALLRLGSRTTLMGEWWQPLGPGSPVFGVASWRRDAQAQDVYEDGERVARLGVSGYWWRAAVGVSLGRVGDLQLGMERFRARIAPLLSRDAAFGPGSTSAQQAFLRLRLDTLDSMAFPTRGALVQATLRSGSLSGLAQGAEAEFGALLGFRLGNWAGHAYVDASHAAEGYAPLALGGFWRLSGTPIRSVVGQTSLLGRVVMGVPVARMPLGLGAAVRAGFSLELGGVFPPGQGRQLEDLKQAGSAFVSVDTRFGPLYFALGATHRGGRAAYVFLGPFW